MPQKNGLIFVLSSTIPLFEVSESKNFEPAKSKIKTDEEFCNISNLLVIISLQNFLGNYFD